MIKLIKNLFKSKTTKLTREDAYLASSTSLEEVERRQREIMDGRAPWQVKARYYL